MKNQLCILILSAMSCMASFPIGIKQSRFTTNDSTSGTVAISEIASSASQSVTQYVSIGIIDSAGSLTIGNFHYYSDASGAAASIGYPQSTAPGMATPYDILAASNYFYSPMFVGFNNQVTTSNAWLAYSNSTSRLTPQSTNSGTFLGTSVATGIAAGSGVTIATNYSSLGITSTITLLPGSVVYITNINSILLAEWGAFTTNYHSWADTLAPKHDWFYASSFFQDMADESTFSSMYLAKGTYLTPASSLNYSKFTNAPAIPGTNGFVKATIFLGFATTNYVLSQDYLRLSSTNFLVLTQSVVTAASSYATSGNLTSMSNSVLASNSSASNSLSLKWGTNHIFVQSLVLNSNLVSVMATNNGVVFVTIGSKTNLYSSSVAATQPGSANLTNWSNIATSRVLVDAAPFIDVLQGRGIIITKATNSLGIAATISSSQTASSFVQVASGWFGNSAFDVGSVPPRLLKSPSAGGIISWPSQLLSSPGHYFVYKQSDGSDVSSVFTNLSASASSITGSAPMGNGAFNVYVVGATY